MQDKDNIKGRRISFRIQASTAQRVREAGAKLGIGYSEALRRAVEHGLEALEARKQEAA